MSTIPQAVFDEIRFQLEAEVLTVYKKLVSSRYFSPAHLEQLAGEAKEVVGRFPEHKQWIGYVVYIERVYQLARETGQLQASQRRLQHFFHALIAALLLIKPDPVSSSNVYQNLLSTCLRHFVSEADQAGTPWPRLLHALLTEMPAEISEKVDHYLSKYLHAMHTEKETALVASLSFLMNGKEREALGQLKGLSAPLVAHDLTEHVQWLAKKECFATMKKWLKTLFPNQNGHFGSLQSYADQMEAALQTQSTDVQYDLWDRWLHAPNMRRYESFVRHLGKEQMEAVHHYILPRLKNRLHNEAASLAYIRLLSKNERYEEARDYFLTFELNPISLHAEKKQSLYELAENKPEFAKPVYHQFIVRLAEKRSRKYYVEAARYTKELESLYTKTNEEDVYQAFFKRLKQTYKTYRAFVEELNKSER
ncbi:hypothetical protein [Shouchella shacheensis]|uniref:hypothetical protein n=1 Tax=Shouchella shacheensis TaxID=1649580 RepID=UPI00074027E8|nr:hypothetical protein [Shouchella shacheensis]